MAVLLTNIWPCLSLISYDFGLKCSVAAGGDIKFSSALVKSYHLSWRYNVEIKLFHHNLYDISTVLLIILCIS